MNNTALVQKVDHVFKKIHQLHNVLFFLYIKRGLISMWDKAKPAEIHPISCYREITPGINLCTYSQPSFLYSH